MAIRALDHLLQFSDSSVRRAVPLSLGLLNISNPELSIMDTLSKLSHDSDAEVADNAIFSLGLIGAGTNNARIGQLLKQLSIYYSKSSNTLFIVRLAQGLLYMGKGLVSLSPLNSDKFLLSNVSLCGILTVLHCGLDMKNTFLGQYHYLLYSLAISINPRYLLTIDNDLNKINESVRVGQAVDIVAQAGRPKTITGFQTHNTPVIIQSSERVELGTAKYIPSTSILEDVVILIKNKDFIEE